MKILVSFWLMKDLLLAFVSTKLGMQLRNGPEKNISLKFKVLDCCFSITVQILKFQEGTISEHFALLFLSDFYYENFRSLHPEFSSLDYQAVHCQLAAVEPLGGTWSLEATKFLRSLIGTTNLRAEIKCPVVELTRSTRMLVQVGSHTRSFQIV